MSDQPEALRLAEQLSQAAYCLRRQHAEIGSSQQAQRDAENELSRTMARHAMAEAELRAERDALHAEIEALKAERDALRAELREATEAVDDPAVNNLRTLPQSIRMLRADAERYRWLRNCARATSEHWGGRWSLVIEGPAPGGNAPPERIDSAIDAARKAK